MLLNTLYGKRPEKSHVSGKIWVNEQLVDPSLPLAHWLPLAGEVAFCKQDDFLQDQLTVYENLYFSAEARLPRSENQKDQNKFSYTKKQRLQLIERVIEILELEGIRDTLVGSAETQSQTISGGQRKRCSIAVELVADSRLLFLDEPTSALDSSTAFSLLSSLKTLTRESGLTVILSIHQPRFGIFKLLDQVFLMGNEGRGAYLGPPELALPYFKALGFPFPNEENPADFVLDLLAGEIQRPGDPEFQPSDLPLAWAKFCSIQNPKQFVPFIQANLGAKQMKKKPTNGDNSNIPIGLVDSLARLPLSSASLRPDFLRQSTVSSPKGGLLPKHREIINRTKPAVLQRLHGFRHIPLLTDPDTPRPPDSNHLLPPQGLAESPKARPAIGTQSKLSPSHSQIANNQIKALSLNKLSTAVGRRILDFTSFQAGIISKSNSLSSLITSSPPTPLVLSIPNTPRLTTETLASPASAVISPEEIQFSLNPPLSPSLLRQQIEQSGISNAHHQTDPIPSIDTSAAVSLLQMPVDDNGAKSIENSPRNEIELDQMNFVMTVTGVNEEIPRQITIETGTSTAPAPIQSPISREFNPSGIQSDFSSEFAMSIDQEEALNSLEILLMKPSSMTQQPPFQSLTRSFPPFYCLFLLILHRETLKMLRQYHHLIFDFVFLILSGLLLGALYAGSWSIGDYGTIATLATLCFGVLSSVSGLRRFALDRPVFWRECASGLSSTVYGLTVLLLDTLRFLIFPAVFLSVFYYILQIRGNLKALFGIYALVCWVGTGFGLALSALLPPTPAFLSSVMLPMLLGFLSGVSPPLANLSTAGLFFCGLSYVRWAVEAMNIIELEAMPSHLELQRSALFKSVGWDRDGMRMDVGILIAMGFFLRVVAIIALKYVDRERKS